MAKYSVVRYIADPVRNEPINIGVLLWDDQRYALVVDKQALDRLVQHAPWLDRVALLGIEPALREEMQARWCGGAAAFEESVRNYGDFPVLLTEPRFTAIDGGFDATLDRLLDRLVRPYSTDGPGGEESPNKLTDAEVAELARQVAVLRERLERAERERDTARRVYQVIAERWKLRIAEDRLLCWFCGHHAAFPAGVQHAADCPVLLARQVMGGVTHG